MKAPSLKIAKITCLPVGKENLKFRNDGFSLIEVMFAMIFLTIIVFGVIKLQTSNLMMSDSQNNELKAHFIANQGLAIVEGIGKTEISNKCSDAIYNCELNTSYTLTCNNNAEIITGSPDFSRTIEIEALNGTPPTGYKVTAVVEWEDSTSTKWVNGEETIDKHKITAERIIY